MITVLILALVSLFILLAASHFVKEADGAIFCAVVSSLALVVLICFVVSTHFTDKEELNNCNIACLKQFGNKLNVEYPGTIARVDAGVRMQKIICLNYQ